MVDGTGQRLPISVIYDLVKLRQPFLLKYYYSQFEEPLHNPLGTITTNCEHYQIVAPAPKMEPFLLEFRQHMQARGLDEPITTIATSGNHHALAYPVIVPVNHGNGDLRCYSTDQVFPTITSVDAWAIAQAVKRPFLLKYNGTGGPLDTADPLHTISTRDRFGLVTPEIVLEEAFFSLDILFRMLKVRELAAATSFPKSYHFMGESREDNVKLIGNAVPVEMGTALCDAIFRPYLDALAMAA